MHCLRHERFCGQNPFDMTLPAPIGVFDSGIGGLSILKALRNRLPNERFVYFADSAHAPYGERDEEHVIRRSLAITSELRKAHGIKALVVACNTATAAAIAAIRKQHPNLPVVGVEPAIKPAVALTKTGHIGVLATRGTVTSVKFKELLATLTPQAHFQVIACDGLAHAIEAMEISKTIALIDLYTSALGSFGSKNGDIDTLVLGCTHYPLEQAAFQQTVGLNIALVEPGEAVARQLCRVLQQANLLVGSSTPTPSEAGVVTWLTSAPTPFTLMTAVKRWLPDTGQRRHTSH